MSFDALNFTLFIINIFTFVIAYATLIKGIRLHKQAKNLLNDTQRILMLYSSRRRSR